MDRRLNLLALAIVLLLAVGLRVWDFPARYELRGVDEIQYTQGSLELLEGMTPAYKYAPAGTETWLGWGYAGSKAAKYMIHPTAEEKQVPLQVRPFVAVNHALFDLYHDLSGIRRFIVICSLVLSVLAVMAAFAVGSRLAGISAGVLLGGLFAVTPLMINYAEQARSFSMSWSFVMIAVYFAVCRVGKTALWGSAIFLGLAISQRIDMLVLMPLVWLEIWYSIRERRQLIDPALPKVPGVLSTWGTLWRHVLITMTATLLMAPWLLTNLIGNLRTIFTVRFSTPPGGPIPISTTLLEFSWTEGLGIIAVIFVVGCLYGLVSGKLPRPLICVYALIFLPTVLKSTGHEIAHQTAAILALFIVAPLAVAAICRSPRAVWAMVLISLALPLSMAIRAINQQHKQYVADDATGWVESHVPGGTLVMVNPVFHDPLPTAGRADALWQEEMNNAAAMKKFREGLKRFNLGEIEMPRALSEENMIVERVERRGWYILGSRSSLAEPRYDIHLYGQSMVFGSTNPWAEFEKTGGVLIWRGAGHEGLKPIMKWVNAEGFGTYIYCSADVRSKITP